MRGAVLPRPRVMERPRNVIFKIDEEDYERLKEIARKKGASVSELLRHIVKQAIEGSTPASVPEAKGDNSSAMIIGVTRPLTTEELLQLIDWRIYDEISKAKARVILNGIIELKRALQQARDAQVQPSDELKEKLRELRDEYRELSREVRSQSVLKPLGEELVMLIDRLGVPLFEGKGRSTCARRVSHGPNQSTQ